MFVTIKVLAEIIRHNLLGQNTILFGVSRLESKAYHPTHLCFKHDNFDYNTEPVSIVETAYF
jgi:hypothetical protein